MGKVSSGVPAPQALTPTTRRLIERIHASPVQMVMEFAGAGSLALFWLHSVAGSSRTILEASDRYSPQSLADLLDRTPASAVSCDTAMAMAEQAYRRSIRLSEDATSCVGIGCTAAIATNRARRGDHRCWIAVQDCQLVRFYGISLLKGARDRLGEESIVACVILYALAAACGIEDSLPDLLAGEKMETGCKSVVDPVQQLLQGRIQSVSIYPDGRREIEAPLRGAILSGSFNPLHAGHEALARAAEAESEQSVIFELPVINADKPPLTSGEIERRLSQFRRRYQVALTRAPLFYDKAALFPGSTFIVGYDTAARLVNPRYYGGEKGRDEALRSFRAAKCRFLVAGRTDQDRFCTLDDIAIPTEFRDLFRPLPGFRVDLSSSAIRASEEQIEAPLVAKRDFH